MSLKRYSDKRNQANTPEPSHSGQSKATENRFVIHKHDASNLHYDFRLEVDGALKSWAVPKGPSTDPSEKRLAIMVEDHPLDYANFEGVIPEGEYGAGVVMLWESGTYDNIQEQSMSKCVQNGQIEVFLHGEKLTGAYVLKKMQGRKNQWLLIKMADEYADARRNPTSTETKSVLSKKTLEQIKKDYE